MWITLTIVLVVVIILYQLGKSNFNKNLPILSEKYDVLCRLLMAGHKESRIWKDMDNALVLGVKNYGGNTLFYLSDTVDGKVSIKYEVSDNPVTRNFSLRFEFSQNLCRTNPEVVFEKIQTQIGKHIMAHMRV